jgi:hypothetical protein
MNDKDFEKSMKKLGFDESHWDSSFGCFFMVIMMFGMIFCWGVALALSLGGR